MSPDDVFLTPAEVCKILRVTDKTPGRWARAGKIPDLPDGRPGAVQTLGGHWRFRLSVIRGIADGRYRMPR